MKKVILFAIIISLISCKKNSPPATIDPSVAILGQWTENSKVTAFYNLGKEVYKYQLTESFTTDVITDTTFPSHYYEFNKNGSMGLYSYQIYSKTYTLYSTSSTYVLTNNGTTITMTEDAAQLPSTPVNLSFTDNDHLIFYSGRKGQAAYKVTPASFYQYGDSLSVTHYLTRRNSN